MQTIMVADDFAEELLNAQSEAGRNLLRRKATEFIDVTSASDDELVLVHALTGRKLRIRCEWED